MEFTESQKELRREYYRQYYAANCDRINERRRTWYAENGDRIRAERRLQYREHPERQAEYTMRSIERRMANKASETLSDAFSTTECPTVY